MTTVDCVQVTITHVPLDLGADSIHLGETLLSWDERDRASRFRLERDRHRYVAARSALRRILARRVGTDPRDLRFTYGRHGKPALDGAPRDLHFNLAHSEGEAIVAVAEGVPVGVDIERDRPNTGRHAVARYVFSEGEQRTLRTAGDTNRSFLQGWTRKEAYVKALGVGLFANFRDVSVALGPSPALLATPFQWDDPAEWTIVDLSRHKYVAALAVRALRLTIRYTDPDTSSRRH